MTAVALVPTFAALGDQTRWEILVALADDAASASSLANRFPLSRQAIAKHLAVLEAVGVVKGVRAGRELRFEVLGAQLRDTAATLEHIGRDWEARLAEIKRIAESLSSGRIKT